LAVLAELDVLVGLKALQPDSRGPLVPPMSYGNLIRKSKEISRNT
jgi:hypothetical protein